MFNNISCILPAIGSDVCSGGIVCGRFVVLGGGVFLGTVRPCNFPTCDFFGGGFFEGVFWESIFFGSDFFVVDFLFGVDFFLGDDFVLRAFFRLLAEACGVGELCSSCRDSST